MGGLPFSIANAQEMQLRECTSGCPLSSYSAQKPQSKLLPQPQLKPQPKPPRRPLHSQPRPIRDLLLFIFSQNKAVQQHLILFNLFYAILQKQPCFKKKLCIQIDKQKSTVWIPLPFLTEGICRHQWQQWLPKEFFLRRFFLQKNGCFTLKSK